MKMKILLIFLSVVFLNSCGGVGRNNCSQIYDTIEKEECYERNQRWYNERGWKYDRYHLR